MADVEWNDGRDCSKCRSIEPLVIEVILMSGRVLMSCSPFFYWTELESKAIDAAKTEALALVRTRLRESLVAAGEPDHAAMFQVMRAGLEELRKYARAAQNENEGTDAGDIAANVAASITAILDVADNCYDIPVEKASATDV